MKSCLKNKHSGSERRRHRKQQVCFGEVQFQEYPLIMGDNPHCTGAPLQLDWICTYEEFLDIDFYEYTRDPRRSKKQLHMPAVDREIYLLTQGYSMEEILEAGDRGMRIRKARVASFQNKKWDRFHVVMESARQAFSTSMQHTVSAKTA